ncbi:MAG: cell surface protein SprA [Candidatus Zixiibacteriota bacterium]
MPDQKSLDYKVDRDYVAEVDFRNGVVIITEYVNGHNVYESRVIPIDEFKEFLIDFQYRKAYTEEIQKKRDTRTDGDIRFEIPVDIGDTWREIVGEGGVALDVNGRHEITIQGRSEWHEGQALAYDRNERGIQPHMEQKSNFNITGTIGSKIKVNVNQDSERSQNLKNTINIKYDGEEDDIIQSIEAGNTNISLGGAEFVGYSEQVRGLFGLKSEFRIGDLQITAIASQEQGETERKTRTEGAQRRTREINDIDYKGYTYYWIDDIFIDNETEEGDSIVQFELYSTDDMGSGSVNYINANAVYDRSFLDSTSSSNRIHDRFFRIEDDKYWVDRKEGWFSFENPFPSNQTLAARYILKHRDGTQDTVGQIFLTAGGDTSWLKLIQPYDNNSKLCWRYMWRNVYDLGFWNLTPEEVKVDIVTIVNDEEVYANGTPYVELFGMDNYDMSGAAVNDGFVDPVYINYARGELIFPVRQPFAPTETDIDSVPALEYFEEADQVPSIYDVDAINSDRQRESQYAIRIEARSRSATMDLGFGVLEGSETVKLRGRTLVRGQDYVIDYTLGRITFISNEAKDPNATITVDYESEPYFMIEKKTLLGTRAKYFLDMDEKNWIGGTVLHRSISMVEQRPRVGGEPNKATIWDIDLNLTEELPFITRAVNALPLVRTEEQSSFTLEAEYAEVHANPNTADRAYIDDFEGVKDIMNLGVRRTKWKHASAPVGWDQNQKALINWYNPWDGILINDIWREKETTTQDSRTDILKFVFSPDTTRLEPYDSDSAWTGVMQYIGDAYNDLSTKQFLEVWVKGGEGKLRFDFGHISEDIDGDGVLDSEDKADVNGIRDNILDTDEDVGLDGRTDREEQLYYLSLVMDSVAIDTLSRTEQREVFESFYDGKRSWNDPEDDNWSYDDDHYDYSDINGTQGNREDLESAIKPDTEDLNLNNQLDRRNDYYSFEIDLSTTEFEVQDTRYDPADRTSWRLYRIPIQDNPRSAGEDFREFPRDSVGSPDWESVEYVRVWSKFDPEDAPDPIQIASMELVGATWLEEFDNFYISAKNTDENADYYSPPGVEGERDYYNDIQRSEQSMVLRFDQLAPLDTVFCYRILTKPEDYTLYKNMRFFVHYDTTEYGSPADYPEYMFRLGTSENIYYEIKKPLAHGWDSVEIDFEIMTNLKNDLETIYGLLENNTHDELNAMGYSSDSIAALEEFVENPTFTNSYGTYRIQGSLPNRMPTFTQIKYFSMGIINTSPDIPISGEAWVDELHVTDVRNEPGSAKRVELQMNFADLLDFNGNIQQREDDFHGLTEKMGTGSDETSGTFSTTLHSNKFFPERWNMSFPVRYSYSQRKELPRLMPDSDIILSGDDRELNKSTEYRHELSSNLAIRPEEAPWYLDYTIYKMSLSYSLGKTVRHEPIIDSLITTNWSGTHTYDLTLNRNDNLGIPLFGWLGDTLPEYLDHSLYLIPTKLSLRTSVDHNQHRKIDRYNNLTTNLNKQLTHTATLNSNLIEPLSHVFKYQQKRDITDYKFKIQHPMIVGRGVSKELSNNFTLKPNLFSNFLTHSYKLDLKYVENTDPSRYIDKWGKADLTRNFSADIRFDHLKLFGIESSRGRGRRNRPKRGDTSPADTEEEEEDSEEGKSFTGVIGNALKGGLKLFSPFNFKMQREFRSSELSLKESPWMLYQFGLTSDPGVGQIALSGNETQQQSRTWTDSYTLTTGMDLPADIKVDLSSNYTYNQSVTSNTNVKKSLTLPDVKVTWGFISNLEFFKKVASSVRSQSAYKLTRSVDKNNDEKTSDQTEHSVNPLVSLNVNWKMGLQSNLQIASTMTYTNSTNLQDVQKRERQDNATLTLSYNIRANTPLKIPIIDKKIDLENNLNLKLTNTYSRRLRQERLSGGSGGWSNQLYTEELSIIPSATYKFSKLVDASFSYTFLNNNDKKTGIKRRVRQLSVKVILSLR